MCGIVGYTGGHEAAPVLVAGLRRLEYRGYDSAGIATLDRDRLLVRKRAGRVRVLEETLEAEPAPGSCGISHTRWATHGPATDRNAHPHTGGRGGRPVVAVVHNGVIENHAALRRELEAEGFAFASQTDTEVIAHLIARELGDGADLFAAVQRACPAWRGPTAWPRSAPRCPGQVVGARLGSPLVVGLGEGEHLIASDPVAIAPHTARVAYLDDGEVVRMTPHDFEIQHRERGPITPRVDRLDWKPDAVELGGHAHYMLKEIREQPDTLYDACRGRIRRAEATAQFGGLNLSPRQLRRVRRVVFAACGTSWHAALVGEYLIERLAHLPVEVEYASEFRYRNAPLDDDTLVFVLSQSGETADTLGALRESKRRGYPTLGIVNTVGRLDRARVRRRDLPARRPRGRRGQHQGVHGAGRGADPAGALPGAAAAPLVLRRSGRGRRHRGGPGGDRPGARVRAGDRRGRRTGRAGPQRPVPRPRPPLPRGAGGALKLKEISYIHAEGYPTAEMKHGPIALIDRETPCVFAAPRGPLHAKTLGNIEEVRARHGMVIAVGTEGDEALSAMADVFLPIPDVPEVVQPLVTVVPLQLLAYHVARLRGCDIDKPRNLAKSVTVE